MLCNKVIKALVKNFKFLVCGSKNCLMPNDLQFVRFQNI